jgi:signal transduction histidine kinase
MNVLYLALKDDLLSPSTRRYLTTAEQELARVAHVTTQTLRFHRQSTSAARADLSEIMESAFSLYASRFTACQIEVQRDYAANTEIHCYGDELRQVFANLLSNALDATPYGGRLRVRIRQTVAWDGQVEHGVRVTVADTGSGIPADLRKHVFEPFVSTKEDTGTGLGLWVTETIMQKHGGRIRMRSSTDTAKHGTVFFLFFPHQQSAQ